MVQKERANRQQRLEKFRRTGRIVLVEPQAMPSSFESLGAEVLEDEIVQAPHRPVKRRVWLDRLLLFIEVAAILGLAFILFNGFSIITNLKNEVSPAAILPTLTPTAVIQAVVLPSGHTPPNSPGGVQPNNSEIPEHLRPLVQTLANLPVPTSSPEQAIRIQIPSIGIDAPVVQGDGWEQLKKGVGQHVGTPNPGEKGNIVVSAHNDVFGEIFKDLDKLEKGDEVVLYTSQRAYVYTVQQTQIVEPTQVEVMGATLEPVITLISCYPYLVDNQRIVVTAALSEQR